MNVPLSLSRYARIGCKMACTPHFPAKISEGRARQAAPADIHASYCGVAGANAKPAYIPGCEISFSQYNLK
jgi:hypothetical protein